MYILFIINTSGVIWNWFLGGIGINMRGIKLIIVLNNGF